MQGKFFKYVNNNGELCTNGGDSTDLELQELSEKAQCLVHYSYHWSKEHMMLLDLQGSYYHLYDPEIATKELCSDEKDEFYFCCGNLAHVAIQGFLRNHTCNKYCEMMGIDE